MNNRQKVMDQDLKLVWTILYCNQACITVLLLSFFDIPWYQNAELKATFDDIEDLKKQEKSCQQRILKTKEDLAAAEKELEDLQPYELPKAENVSWSALLHYTLLCLHIFSYSLWLTGILSSLCAHNNTFFHDGCIYTSSSIFCFCNRHS